MKELRNRSIEDLEKVERAVFALSELRRPGLFSLTEPRVIVMLAQLVLLPSGYFLIDSIFQGSAESLANIAYWLMVIWVPVTIIALLWLFVVDIKNRKANLASVQCAKDIGVNVEAIDKLSFELFVLRPLRESPGTVLYRAAERHKTFLQEYEPRKWMDSYNPDHYWKIERGLEWFDRMASKSLFDTLLTPERIATPISPVKFFWLANRRSVEIVAIVIGLFFFVIGNGLDYSSTAWRLFVMMVLLSGIAGWFCAMSMAWSPRRFIKYPGGNSDRVQEWLMVHPEIKPFVHANQLLLSCSDADFEILRHLVQTIRKDEFARSKNVAKELA